MNVVPFTVSLSSVSVRPLAIVTTPLFRPALLIALGPVMSMLPNKGELVPMIAPSLMMPPLMVAPETSVLHRRRFDHAAGIGDIDLNIKRTTSDLDRSGIRNSR